MAAATTLFNKTALANGTSNLIVRADAINLSTDLVQAGVVFNDAVRLSLGLFNLAGSGNSVPFLGNTPPISMRCRTTSPRFSAMPPT